jgi:hypothetical protein
MDRQLHLLTNDDTSEHDWRLDAQTRAVGRKGLAQARAALRAAAARRGSRAPASRPLPQSSSRLRSHAA